MQRVVPLLALAAALASAAMLCGCGALEELDAANAMMDARHPKKPDETTDARTDGDTPARKRLDWTNVRSLDSGELDPAIVSCRIGGATTFTSRDECWARGGKPDGV